MNVERGDIVSFQLNNQPAISGTVGEVRDEFIRINEGDFWIHEDQVISCP